MTELERLGRLERMLDKFTIAGAGVNVEGDLHRGYAIDTGGFEIGGISGGTAGACCTGSTCSTLTAAGCASIGGTYLGDGTACFPNPCTGGGGATGACCVGSDCSITTAAACASAGGTYQGDGTSCSPSPCPLPPCEGCGFSAFDGSGRKFLTRTTELLETLPICCVGSVTHNAQSDRNCIKVETIDTDTCAVTTQYFGSASRTFCDGHVDNINCNTAFFTSPPYVNDSATHRTWDNTRPCGYEPTCPGLNCITIQTESLSDECEP